MGCVMAHRRARAVCHVCYPAPAHRVRASAPSMRTGSSRRSCPGSHRRTQVRAPVGAVTPAPRAGGRHGSAAGRVGLGPTGRIWDVDRNFGRVDPARRTRGGVAADDDRQTNARRERPRSTARSTRSSFASSLPAGLTADVGGNAAEPVGTGARRVRAPVHRGMVGAGEGMSNCPGGRTTPCGHANPG
jgi:hypothetical protein